ncbi:Carboxypeptidase regulatory-like domain-containing protein [Granulicella rosea]|uniref:Carboxypeptidase regulatory-like domain-containing protein n=1 Tax=Granulicella rosea TaxID=474952 RepID=A0A239MJF1_9BACT|nr:carboxypeptidase regulatory-like domain-containing protein [Granulicella rosea]SNT42771.1 Carboxypeptidase regulatory-like domain-containing protein [Granulicella rosea]
MRRTQTGTLNYGSPLGMACGVVLVTSLAAGFHPSAFAQSDSGRVVGTVTDTSGALIPGATITLTNVANGTVRVEKSGASGELNIAALPAGNYSARIEATGFQSQSLNFTLVVTQVQSLSFKLTPGETTTTIEVESAAQVVNTSDPTLGETIEGKQITELPLNGRNALNLALLAPGVTGGVVGEASNDPSNRNGENGGTELSVNGSRSQANNFILDGVDNNDGLQNIILFFPPVEATQEFKVNTSVSPAQFGRGGGGLIIASYKSGTNQYHGSAFYFYRSGKFAANNNYLFPSLPTFVPKPPFNRNQYGGAMGLPILKDHLFLFGDYEGTRESLPGNLGTASVPTVKMRTGDFSELLNPTFTNGQFQTTFPVCLPNAGTLNANIPANSKGQIYDPQTCQPFAGNIIPTARLNPAAVNYLNAYPLPTRSNEALQNYSYQQQSAIKYNRFNARTDWAMSPKDLFFFRFSYDNSVNGSTSKFPKLPHDAGTSYVHARGYDLGYTRTINTNIVNEARLAYNRDDYGYQPPFYGQNISANLGIVNANRSIETSGGALIGGNNGQLEYTGDYGLFAVPQNTYELTDTLNLQLKNHSLKVGGTYLRREVAFFRPISGKGFFSIAGNGAGYTGWETSELLVGGTSNYAIGAQNGFFANESQEDALFIQDDWRVNRRLTLNLGVRYDLITWPYEKHDQQAAFDPNTGALLLAGKNGVPRSIVNQDNLLFAPRIGFAYDVFGTGKTALHGGYGIFYFPDYGGISNQLGQNPPYGGTANYSASQGYCITFTGQTAQGAPYTCPGYTVGTAATGALPLPGFPNFNAANPPAGLGGVAVDVNNKHSRQQQFNLQVQQQLGKNDTVSVAYVGAHADRLSTYYPINSPTFNFPGFKFPNLAQYGVTLNKYNGISWYNGLQTHFEHRQGNALLTGSYTWSHALDDSGGAYIGSTVALPNNPLASYGNSGEDQRHIFSGSAVYSLPFGKHQKYLGSASRVMDLVVGGWQTNLIGFFATGQPFEVSTGLTNMGNYPDKVGPITYPKQITGRWFNPAAFSSANIPVVVGANQVTVYTREGTLGRNQVFGPGFRTINLGLQKNLHMTDRISLELHGDAFNALNTPQFTSPNSNVSDTFNFGKVLGTRQNSAREIQLSSRLVF